jgi:ubiquinone/menaquinone biosynthesis C-methylase UbiE
MEMSSKNFKDYFSNQAAIYAKARPTYPDALFQWLSLQCTAHNLVWDCATGNGQAAVSLARYFDKVIATDASDRQIENAIEYEGVTYKTVAAEMSGLETDCYDLVTVAQAAHWFDLPLFYKECSRVLKPNGVLSVWSYSEAQINSEIDEVTERFMYGFLGSFWPENRNLVRNKYQSLYFPFQRITAPEFYCEAKWNREEWMEYVRTWSAYQLYCKKYGTPPDEVLLEALKPIWKDGKVSKRIRWPIHLLATTKRSLDEGMTRF